MRPVWLLTAFLVACSGSTQPRRTLADDPSDPGAFAAEDHYVPTYGKSELSRALQRERGAEASQERAVAELEAKLETRTDAGDQWRVASADLEVRRRFIRSLETCEASGRWCPPRLDDPPWQGDVDALKIPVTTELRFDLASWRKLADELHGRACACRTIACVDLLGIAIDAVETRPMPDVQGDEQASLSITRGRECLFRLRGKHHRYRAQRVEVD